MQTPPAPIIGFHLNGEAREVAREPERGLLGVLRDELGVTSPKPGCGEGECGACTVLLDGEPVRSCRTWLSAADGATIVTVEGLAEAGGLHPVQAAFLAEHAFQCGYCTPGMVVQTVALLQASPHPDDDTVRSGLEGNVCRCGTYPRILAAVRRSAGMTDAVARPADDATAESGQADAAPPLDTARRPAAPWDLTPTRERDWFAVLPEGLVVVLEPAASQAWTTTSGAWLHVAEDGSVTGFSGKVDGGQGNRASLSITIADALGIPATDVRLVMGDTDLCPYDAGTFGSRSTPDAGSELRVVATGTRAILEGLAMERGRAPASSAGRTARPARLRSADLVRGLQRVETVARPAASGAADRTAPTAAGSAPTPTRADLDVVTGAKRFPTDVTRPGMLHGQALHPPAAGATLRSLDVSAVAAPGVTLVHEASFVGVAAATPRVARRALARAKVEWTLPPGPAEDELESHLRSHPTEDHGWEGASRTERGDVDGALAASPVVAEATYRTAFIAHAALETRSAVAEWGSDGRLTVWTATQVPFGVREQLAAELAVPESAVRVIVPDFGGGFGGRHGGEVALEAARLARVAGVPVKVRWSREDEFRSGYARPAAVIDVRAGARRDGTIVAWALRDTNAGPFGLEGPYEIASERLEYQPADSPLPQGSYRALAATANHFARESAMDEIASALEIDPLELRLAHLRDERVGDVLRAAAERIGWTRRREPGVGLGIAGGIEKGARVATAVELEVGADRRVELRRIVTAFDCGAIVDPDGLTNQIQGATVMGLGGALFEALHFDAGGVLRNASLTEYRVPRLPDVPPIEVVLVDRPDQPSAGAGETPIVAVAPAIANAIHDATGVRLREMPLIPDGTVPTPSA